VLEVSQIFNWYGEDFALGHHGYGSLTTLFARHAGQLSADPEGRKAIRAGRYKLRHLDYDWSLNDAR